MSGIIRLKKGLDIPLLGKAKESIQKVDHSATFSVRPDDFVGIKPKVIVKDGDQVKVGSVLFYSKMNPELKFVSPVSGEVVSVNRGAKRKVLDIQILAYQLYIYIIIIMFI
jgi:Na+-transporting NADH:ubiquinone oxidoreductase subunit A